MPLSLTGTMNDCENVKLSNRANIGTQEKEGNLKWKLTFVQKTPSSWLFQFET